MANNLIIPAQVLALSGSALLSGYIFSFSHVSIRSLLAIPSSTVSPSEKAQLWTHLYGIGVRTAPPFAAASAGLFTYLAVQTSEKMYGLAAAFTIAIAPWTALCMRGVNRRLHAKAVARDEKEVSGLEEEVEVQELLTEWALWNSWRALLPLIGCGFGWWAMSRS